MNNTIAPSVGAANRPGNNEHQGFRPKLAPLNPFLRNRMPLVVAALLLTVLPRLCTAQVPIEQMQREFQARFHFVTYGNYVLWPPCRSGMPAPLYPPDKFYGDLSGDPLFAA